MRSEIESRSGKSRQPRFGATTTTPRSRSSGPGAPTPTPRKSAFARFLARDDVGDHLATIVAMRSHHRFRAELRVRRAGAHGELPRSHPPASRRPRCWCRPGRRPRCTSCASPLMLRLRRRSARIEQLLHHGSRPRPRRARACSASARVDSGEVRDDDRGGRQARRVPAGWSEGPVDRSRMHRPSGQTA